MAIQDFYNVLTYHELEYTDTDTGGQIVTQINSKDISGIVRVLYGRELVLAEQRNYESSHRLYTSSKDLNLDGIVNDKYRITHVNNLMRVGEFYQYEMVLI